jgi:hypothetical protein
MHTALPTNPAALVAELKHSAKKILEILEQLGNSLEIPIIADPRSPKKGGHSHLTYEEIKVLYTDFAEKKLTNKKIAEKNKISMSGLIQRKSMWKRGIY